MTRQNFLPKQHRYAKNNYRMQTKSSIVRRLISLPHTNMRRLGEFHNEPISTNNLVN